MPTAGQAINSANPYSISPIIERDQAQWLFKPEDFRHTPSRVEGMSAGDETALRRKGINFIVQVGIMLKLPQMALATASVYFHRFYMRHPLQINGKGVHHYQIAGTALYLASKVEESSRKMHELVVACCRVAQKQPNLVIDEQSKEFWKWRDTILHHELLMLEVLCFDLQLEHLYPILYEYLRYYGIQDNKPLRNTSWAFINDSHTTTLCLLIPPRAIAGSALYAGAKLAGVSLPDDEQGRPWWEHLELDLDEMSYTINTMADTYENPATPRQGPKEAYMRDADFMSFERTRLTRSPSAEKSPARSQRSVSQGVKRDRDEAGWGEESPANGHGEDARHIPRSENPSPKRQRRAPGSSGDNDGTVLPTRIPRVAVTGESSTRRSGADDARTRDEDGSYTSSGRSRRLGQTDGTFETTRDNSDPKDEEGGGEEYGSGSEEGEVG